MSFDPAKPYNKLPLLPPKYDLESKAVLKKCVTASQAITELKIAGNLIPNQSVLINTIPLLEARASSEIENIVTTTDRLFQYSEHIDSNTDPATKEALRYRTALQQGFISLSQRPLSTATAVRVCSTIKDSDMDIRRVPGTTLMNELSGKVIYTPPDEENRLRSLMGNWEKFIHERTEIEPLIRMAVSHYQFEAIHPFIDGNGRTGRIVNLLFLIEQKLLDIPILYLSRYIIQNKESYYQYLQQVTEHQKWDQWVLFMLDAVEQTAIWTSKKIMAIRQLIEHTHDYVRGELPGAYAHDVVEQVFVQPYCRINNLVDSGIVKRQTASEYLKKLVALGVLEEVKAGREKVFIHPKLIQLLKTDDNAFADYG